MLTRESASIAIYLAKAGRRIRWKAEKIPSLLLCSTAAMSPLPSSNPGICDKFGKDKAIFLFSPLHFPVVLLSFDAIMKIFYILILIPNINKSVAIFLSQPRGLKM